MLVGVEVVLVIRVVVVVIVVVQNRVQCRICGQAVCIKHRFEDQHPCVDLEAAIREALRLARAELRPEEYAEAHSTIMKVFSNVLKDPKNEKFRTLRKANAVVQEKLKHPACTQALLMCGFADEGECFVCEPGADLSTMRRVCAQLKASPPPASGVRIVDGVIQRPPKAEAQEATVAPPFQGYASARRALAQNLGAEPLAVKTIANTMAAEPSLRAKCDSVRSPAKFMHGDLLDGFKVIRGICFRTLDLIVLVVLLGLGLLLLLVWQLVVPLPVVDVIAVVVMAGGALLVVVVTVAVGVAAAVAVTAPAEVVALAL
ncbi:hypothetical protein AK812_SmicGene22068 [Symbiodinium microadriaticum]|uniref:PUB domain-containing protein n=1 Tax=Symbiodinium microadriaticum TaxID=2951 RepID=A0A1Q9DKP3_SYMMI|nr:hypothetical protein AK812_SmicGene22068 [Symbiodinium microadriaticum]